MLFIYMLITKAQYESAVLFIITGTQECKIHHEVTKTIKQKNKSLQLYVVILLFSTLFILQQQHKLWQLKSLLASYKMAETRVATENPPCLTQWPHYIPCTSVKYWTRAAMGRGQCNIHWASQTKILWSGNINMKNCSLNSGYYKKNSKFNFIKIQCILFSHLFQAVFHHTTTLLLWMFKTQFSWNINLSLLQVGWLGFLFRSNPPMLGKNEWKPQCVPLITLETG